jgi:hypothetical protein
MDANENQVNKPINVRILQDSSAIEKNQTKCYDNLSVEDYFILSSIGRDFQKEEKKISWSYLELILIVSFSFLYLFMCMVFKIFN